MRELERILLQNHPRRVLGTAAGCGVQELGPGGMLRRLPQARPASTWDRSKALASCQVSRAPSMGKASPAGTGDNLKGPRSIFTEQVKRVNFNNWHTL